MTTSVYMSREVHTLFAIFNFVACAVLVIIRVYHWKKQKIVEFKLSATGLSSMLLALLCCLGLVNSQSEWYFGDVRWCELSLKVNSGTYSMNRVLLYIFIILRVEVINQSNFISSRFIKAGKAVMGIIGTLTVVIATVFTNGVPDEHFGCGFEMDSAIILPLGIIDFSICAGGTWMFVHPLRLSLKNIECENLRDMIERTTIWSIVSLMSTLVGLLTVTIIDGAGGVVGFDCSITSFSLLMMMSPGSRKVVPKSQSKPEQKVRRVEIQYVNKRPSSGHDPLNKIDR